MEKAVRDSSAKDDASLDTATTTHAPGQGGADAGAAGGSSSGDTAKSSSTAATHDGGWEADASLLAAMGIVVGPAKPASHKADAGTGGGAAKASPAKLPGVATPPKSKPQGVVTPDIKKELQNKKEAKANPAAAGAVGAAGGAQAQGGAAGPQSAEAPKAGAAQAPGAAGEGETQAAGAPGSAATPPGAPAGADPDLHNVDRLIEMLEHDQDQEHRRAAVRALGKLGTHKARAALEKATKDRDPVIARVAQAALAAASR